MEQFNHKGYRDNMASDLKDMRNTGGKSAELAPELLEESKKTDEYQKAKHLHGQDKIDSNIRKIKLAQHLANMEKFKDELGWQKLERSSVTIPIGEIEEYIIEKNRNLAQGENPWRLPTSGELELAGKDHMDELSGPVGYICEGGKVFDLDGRRTRLMEDYAKRYLQPIMVTVLMLRKKKD